MGNQIKARMTQKHDTQANWEKAVNFIPLIGEIIFYDPDEIYSYTRMKVGDGKTVVSELSFFTSLGGGGGSGGGSGELPEVTTDDNDKVLKVVDGEWKTATEIKELPNVSIDDNDKVLTVVDGAWTAQTPTGGSGGSDCELPEVTTDDNDKVLTVVDGVWTAQTSASGLPKVTMDDAGKFLRVGTSGMWIVASISGAEGVGF